MDCSVLLHPRLATRARSTLDVTKLDLIVRVLMQSTNDAPASQPIRRHSTKLVALATCCLTLFAGASAFGQVLRGQAAMGDWRDDKPGLRRLITVRDLPPVAKPTAGHAQVVPRPPDARPQVPDGFTAELVTTDTHKPRVIRVAPNGDLFVA